ncbi:AAA family ATPase [Candidatus Berkelbacteria bacterium]|nr:AAA family ATPase [Candidatus Berkelbacteria bacterium]
MFERRDAQRKLLPLSATQVAVVDRILRAFEQTNPTHVLLSGKHGVGKHVLADHLGRLGQRMGRRSTFWLSSATCATALFEPAAATDFFHELERQKGKISQSIIVIDQLGFLIDGADRTEVRRLSRFLHELLTVYSARCLLIGSTDEAALLLNLSPVLRSLLTSVYLPEMTLEETKHTLQGEGITGDIQELTRLAEEHFPKEGRPGIAQRLWQAGADLARQRGASPSLDAVHEYISEQRSIPKHALSGDVSQRVLRLSEELRKRILGQDHAVGMVARTLQRASVGLRDTTRPIASFLFLGPSGVGKTELAKTVSSVLYQHNRAFIRLDMSEFSEGHTVHRLIGAPPGYVGYEEGGQLTKPVREQPYSLVLLDEIEKAHPKVFDVFLQLLDDGRLTDGQGQTADFRQTVVIATSNIGLHEIVAASENGELLKEETFLRTRLLPLLVEFFRPELLNRFDAIIAFQPLSPASLEQIAARELGTLKQRLERRGFSLHVKPETLAKVLQDAHQPIFGARPLRRLIQQRIENAIAEQLIQDHGAGARLLTV